MKHPQVSALKSCTMESYEKNMLLDALSRLYGYNNPETICVSEEYLHYDADVETGTTNGSAPSTPFLVGMEALTILPRRSSCLHLKETRDVTPPTPASMPTQLVGRQIPPTPLEPAMTARLPRSVWKGTPPPTKTGRPKTGAEFAAQMHDYFVLLDPGERKKGGVGTGTQCNNESDSPNE